MNKLNLEPTPQYFFDDTPKSVFELIKPAYKHDKDLSAPPLLIDQLSYKNLTTGAFVHGKCALYSRFMAFYENDTAINPEHVLEVSYSRIKSLVPTEESPNLGFVLMKNGSSFEFCFSEKQTLENWMNALKNICVLSNFHEEYKATKIIGKGSFAKVYLVDSKSTGKNYAVKAFAKDGLAQANKGNAKATMLNEIDLMRDLVHDNIIKLYEVHETERSIYLVMELIQGKPLQEPLTRQTFRKEYTQQQILEMIHDMLDALAYMASKGIMHRDLKPDNILIDKTGKLKIVDFGLATYINVPEYIFKKCGTPGYIAPEVFKYDAKIQSTFYDHRCDVFSAGCIVFYMLFGYPFFAGSRASEILQLNREVTEFEAIYILKKEIKDPNSKINKEGINLLFQLLEYSQKKRITAAQALSHAYFTTSTHIQKPSSSKELILDSPKHSLTEVSSPTNVKNAEFISSFNSEKGSPSPRVTSGNRYAEKDSLYLDLGKPEMNGKLNTLTNGSANNSINMKGGNINSNNNSLSVFAKQGGNEEGKSPNRSGFKNGYVAGNQSNFLKAAIFNNMQKNNDMGDSPKKKDETMTFQLKLERRQSDNFSLKTSKLQNSGEEVCSSPGSTTSDGDDLGDKRKGRIDFEKLKEENQNKTLDKQDNQKPITH